VFGGTLSLTHQSINPWHFVLCKPCVTPASEAALSGMMKTCAVSIVSVVLLHQCDWELAFFNKSTAGILVESMQVSMPSFPVLAWVVMMEASESLMNI